MGEGMLDITLCDNSQWRDNGPMKVYIFAILAALFISANSLYTKLIGFRNKIRILFTGSKSFGPLSDSAFRRSVLLDFFMIRQKHRANCGDLTAISVVRDNLIKTY